MPMTPVCASLGVVKNCVGDHAYPNRAGEPMFTVSPGHTDTSGPALAGGIGNTLNVTVVSVLPHSLVADTLTT